MAEVIAWTVYSRSFSPASIIARQSASNRRTLSVMLSSTMTSDRAPWSRASLDVRQDPLQGAGVEVASAHFDNRAEAAVEGAPARGLDHVDLPAEERVAAKHPHVA